MDIAMKGLDRLMCPYCGESKTYLDYLKIGITNKGVLTTSFRLQKEGYFEFKNNQSNEDIYNFCYSCGHKW